MTILSNGQYAGTGRNPENQCVACVKDFARQEHFGAILTGNGVDYGNEEHLNMALQTNSPDNPGKYTVYKNGSNTIPREDDIISWSGGDYGHSGFISEVVFNEKTGNGWLFTIEQNYSRNQALFAQPFTRNEQGKFYIEGRGSYDVQGWARYENQSNLFEVDTYTKIQHTPTPQKAIKR